MKRQFLFLALGLISFSLAGCKGNTPVEEPIKENYLAYNLPGRIKNRDGELKNFHSKIAFSKGPVPLGYQPVGPASPDDMVTLLMNEDGLIGIYNNVRNKFIIEPFLDIRLDKNAEFKVIFQEDEVISLIYVHYLDKDLIIDQIGNVYFEGKLEDRNSIKFQIDVFDELPGRNLLIARINYDNVEKVYFYDNDNKIVEVTPELVNKFVNGLDVDEGFIDLDLSLHGHPGYKIRGYIWSKLQILNQQNEVVNEFRLDLDVESVENFAVVGDKLIIQELSYVSSDKDEHSFRIDDEFVVLKSLTFDIFTGEKNVIDLPYVIEDSIPWKDKDGNESYALCKVAKINSKDINSFQRKNLLINSEGEILADYTELKYMNFEKIGNLYFNDYDGYLYNKDFKLVDEIDDDIEVSYVSETGDLVVFDDYGSDLVFNDKGELLPQFLDKNFVAGVIGGKELWFTDGTDSLYIYDSKTLALKETIYHVNDIHPANMYSEFGKTAECSVYILETPNSLILKDLDGQSFELEGRASHIETAASAISYLEGVKFLYMEELFSKIEFNKVTISFCDDKVESYKWTLPEDHKPSERKGLTPIDAIPLTIGENILPKSESALHYLYKSETAQVIDLSPLDGKINVIIDNSGFNWDETNYYDGKGKLIVFPNISYVFLIDTLEAEIKFNLNVIAEEKAMPTGEAENIALVEGKTPAQLRKFVATKTGFYTLPSKNSPTSSLSYFDTVNTMVLTGPVTLEDENEYYLLDAGTTIYFYFDESTEAYDLDKMEIHEAKFSTVEGYDYVLKNDTVNPWEYNKENNSYKSTLHEDGKSSSVLFTPTKNGRFRAGITVSSSDDTCKVRINGNNYTLYFINGYAEIDIDLRMFDSVKITFTKDSSGTTGMDCVTIINPTLEVAA